MGTGATTAGNRTNILLGVLAYNFTNATTQSTASITLNPRIYHGDFLL